jgi:hypothetical protein
MSLIAACDPQSIEKQMVIKTDFISLLRATISTVSLVPTNTTPIKSIHASSAIIASPPSAREPKFHPAFPTATYLQAKIPRAAKAKAGLLPHILDK